MTKELLHVMLELHNMRLKPSNVRKKRRESLNVTKVQSHVILVLHNVRIVPSNARRNNRTIECDKRIVTCDVGIAQCENEIIRAFTSARLKDSVYFTSKTYFFYFTLSFLQNTHISSSILSPLLFK